MPKWRNGSIIVETTTAGVIYQPFPEVRLIDTASTEQIKKNIAHSLSLDLPRFSTNDAVVRGDTVAIVSGGISLNRTYSKIFAFSDVISCGSAHDHIIDLGIKSKYHINFDTSEKQAENYRNKSDAVYLLASRCHSNIFETLTNRKLKLWHKWEYAVGKGAYKNEPVILCGATVALAATSIAILLGYKHLHYFGFDCSGTHAYPQDEAAKEKVISVNGQKFVTTETWLTTIKQFELMQECWGNFFDVKIHGPSLMAEIQKIRNSTIGGVT